MTYSWVKVFRLRTDFRQSKRSRDHFCDSCKSVEKIFWWFRGGRGCLWVNTANLFPSRVIFQSMCAILIFTWPAPAHVLVWIWWFTEAKHEVPVKLPQISSPHPVQPTYQYDKRYDWSKISFLLVDRPIRHRDLFELCLCCVSSWTICELDYLGVFTF